MQSHFFADLHCHPSIKAFARSFRQHAGQQSGDPSHDTSLWYRDAPSFFDKIKNYAASITNFIQSDGTSLLRGRVAVVCLSFYPQEIGFFKNKLGTGLPADMLTMLVSEFGKPRIDHLQQLTSYWDDMRMEMDFLRQGENNKVKVDDKFVSYRIAQQYADIDFADRSEALGETLILFVPSIEGGHVFDQVMDSGEPWNTHAGGAAPEKLELALQRVRQLRGGKDGLIRPLFITFAHHFWNGLCGHARSMGGFVKCVVDQENGLGTGFTPAGKAMAKALLSDATDEAGLPLPRILIDIKHMSRAARLDYFSLLATEFKGINIPILVSHGGVTGLSAPNGIRQTPAAQEGLYMEDDINFYDDELLQLEASGGVFGIQLDERRIGSKQALRDARGNIGRRAILYAWAKLVWNQVRHIAELLDLHGRYAWGVQALGTDFDGIIDPINGYWTSKDLDDLDDYLLKHAFNYLKETKRPCPLLQARNKVIDPEEVVERIMTSNALNFFSNTLPQGIV